MKVDDSTVAKTFILPKMLVVVLHHGLPPELGFACGVLALPYRAC
jgi:hypothetical protein